jgi:hypothetical protein
MIWLPPAACWEAKLSTAAAIHYLAALDMQQPCCCLQAPQQQAHDISSQLWDAGPRRLIMELVLLLVTCPYATALAAFCIPT